MPDPIPTIQSQKEWENMARLQQERAASRERAVTGSYQEDGQFSDEELSEARSDLSIPAFPLVIFFIAILKDVLDFAELSIIGILLSWIATIIFALIIWFWTIGKVGFVKKMIIRRLALMIAIALIPVVDLLPEASIFVLWVHLRETKYIGDLLQAFEKIEL